MHHIIRVEFYQPRIHINHQPIPAALVAKAAAPPIGNPAQNPFQRRGIPARIRRDNHRVEAIPLRETPLIHINNAATHHRHAAGA